MIEMCQAWHPEPSEPYLGVQRHPFCFFSLTPFWRGVRISPSSSMLFNGANDMC